MYLEEMNDAYKVLYYGYTDMATPEDQRKGNTIFRDSSVIRRIRGRWTA
jgi:hypothetical protein